jgi:PAS domain S-box-containing protein
MNALFLPALRDLWKAAVPAPCSNGVLVLDLRCDISELRREAREREVVLKHLRESDARFRQLAENIQEVFWITDRARTEMIYVSPAYEAIWGRTCSKLYATPRIWMDAIHPDDRPRMLEAAAKGPIKGAYEEEYRIVRPDGAVRWIRDRAFPVRNRQGEVYRIAGVAQDVTFRKQNEDRVREQASLLDKAQDAIIVRDLDHRISYWNKSAERLYGWTAEQAVGRRVTDLLYKEVTAYQQACEHVLQRGEWMGEMRQFTRQGDPLAVEGRWTLVRDADGKPQRVLAINTDVTRQKKLEEQFLRAQRMESIGALAGGIAHDLNNVLTPITLAIDFLKVKTTDPKCLEVLDTIAKSAKRGADMVGQVVSFARGADGRRIEVQPRHLITDIERMCRETFPKIINVQTRAVLDLWPVVGDPIQLHQVLLNLCMNARDAMVQGGTLTIHANNVVLDAQFASDHIEAVPGPHVLFEIEDTGTGIPRHVIEKIFDPFFTTKETGKGTGLGLSTSMSIVKSHGGFMQVDSVPGRGTRFSFHLPAKSVANTAAGAEASPDLPRGNGELVLVVDDEDFVRQIARQTLEGFGYRVILAEDGTEAVTLFAKHRKEIAVVVTDMTMPVMDGASTALVLMRMDPNVRVIAASGITTERNVSKADQAGVKHFIPKPYSAEILLHTLKKVLQGQN